MSPIAGLPRTGQEVQEKAEIVLLQPPAYADWTASPNGDFGFGPPRACNPAMSAPEGQVRK